MINQEKTIFSPCFVDLSEKKILVVGAGKIAARRIQTLLPFCRGDTGDCPQGGGSSGRNGRKRDDPV